MPPDATEPVTMPAALTGHLWRYNANPAGSQWFWWCARCDRSTADPDSIRTLCPAFAADPDEVGPCSAPSAGLPGSPMAWCRLPEGHAGDHFSAEGTRWRVTRVAAGDADAVAELSRLLDEARTDRDREHDERLRLWKAQLRASQERDAARARLAEVEAQRDEAVERREWVYQAHGELVHRNRDLRARLDAYAELEAVARAMVATYLPRHALEPLMEALGALTEGPVSPPESPLSDQQAETGDQSTPDVRAPMAEEDELDATYAKLRTHDACPRCCGRLPMWECDLIAKPTATEERNGE